MEQARNKWQQESTIPDKTITNLKTIILYAYTNRNKVNESL